MTDNVKESLIEGEIGGTDDNWCAPSLEVNLENDIDDAGSLFQHICPLIGFILCLHTPPPPLPETSPN